MEKLIVTLVSDQSGEQHNCNGTAAKSPLNGDNCAGESALALYLRDIGRYKLLTRKEETALARRVRKGDAAAREQMIVSNLRLVVKIAMDFCHCGLPLLDLISEGNIGLMKAVDRFDPDVGARFSAYASVWIKQGIRRGLANHGRTVRLPAHIHEKLSALNRAANDLRAELGREPTAEEIAAETHLPSRRVKEFLAAARPTVSLDESAGDSEFGTLAEIVPDSAAIRPDENLMVADIIDLMYDAIGELPAREQKIVKGRFGLNGEGQQTLRELSVQLKVAHERVRQIQNAALKKLRWKMRLRELEGA
ncbi:MAG: RNA polymerase sigma factor RpoD/SigA [Verrucomicrobia subdivision 3 bacterium]|nr:RNA polymerase sigma factor RpoD/SigA [Limisphaerales bacterium]